MIEALVVAAALLAGLGVRQFSLPPMIGFLLAGFLLPLYAPFASIDYDFVTRIGLILLLFIIGLKLNLSNLIRPQVWAVTGLHMGLTIGGFTALFSLLKLTGWSLISDLTSIQMASIGFALSFSSTVFAVKVLEDRGEMNSLHGSLAIGILVMQDLIAVIYLTLIGDKTPALWAPLVLLAIPLRPLIDRLLRHCGHGEMLTLAGFSLALGGAGVFELVDLKGDLGALFIGAVVANTSKAKELSTALLSFKDLLLVGFFLGIGQAGLPSLDAWLMTGLLLLVLLMKPALYFLLLAKFYLRSRTAFSAAMALNNYSEFGLIVMTIAAANGLLPQQWVVILALALSLSYILSSIMIGRINTLFTVMKPQLIRHQSSTELPEQRAIDIGEANYMIMGMGRVGTGAYDCLREISDAIIVGFDENEAKRITHEQQGRHVLTADASDPDFWTRLPLNQIEHLMLCVSNFEETSRIAHLIRNKGYTGSIAAAAKYPDEVTALKEQGIIAFNLYAEAGAGFAEHVHNEILNQP